MACLHGTFGGSAVIISVPDAYGEAVVNGRTWRWDFHEYCGPTFLRANGDLLTRQPGEHHPVWKAFEAWLVARNEKVAL